MATAVLTLGLVVASLLFAVRRKQVEAERNGVLAREREVALADARSAQAALARDNARLGHAAETALLAAEAANRTKDEFLATLSHELRTPLNAIVGWIRVLASEHSDAAGAARAVARLQRHARALAQIVDDLLDMWRLTTGALRLDVRSVSLVTVVESALGVARPAAEAKRIRLRAMLDPRSGSVRADPNRLQQVVWNLVANAIKFTPPQGCVEVRVQRARTYVEVIVGDTGQGIGPDVLPHLFERFRQADGSTTRAHGVSAHTIRSGPRKRSIGASAKPLRVRDATAMGLVSDADIVRALGVLMALTTAGIWRLLGG